MTKVRWGVLSTSNFARNKILPATRDCRHASFLAIASRSLSTAQNTAVQFGIPQAYGSYEVLLKDPSIDAVYLPLPNPMHVPWSIKALEAGKHVLCEKPLAMSADEAKLLAEIAGQHPNLRVMEAFMYRFHPQWLRTQEIVRRGGIGELRTVHSHFSYFNADAGNIRNQLAMGGGGLMDIGCYGISLSRLLFEEEPQRVLGVLEYDPVFQTDRLASGILDFGRGTATFTCSTQLGYYQRVSILGTQGRIEIEIPFNAPRDKPSRIWVQDEAGTKEIEFPPCDQYTLEIDQFSLSVLNNTPVPIPLSDSIANMKVIDAVRESGKANEWVRID